jgi:hypothetical protein
LGKPCPPRIIATNRFLNWDVSMCAIYPPLLRLATSIAPSRLAVIVKMGDLELIEKDRLAGGPILRRKYHERTTFVVPAGDSPLTSRPQS